ncbi:MAG: LysE family translocator [Pseudohongiellaceae bacterium]|nr:LysE family translocator [Pseudohongiellaceae bacterium]
MEYLLSLFVFTFVACATPGPNNIMLLASGVNHGIRNSLPHYFGICIGFSVLVAAVGFGLGALFSQAPLLHQVLQTIGAAYLVYLAWRIASASAVDESESSAKPLSFIEAALFQWVNPKAWIIAVGAIATFTVQSRITQSILTIVAMYFIVGVVAMGIWLTLGASLQNFLKSSKRRRVFNIFMATLLLFSLASII